MQELRRRSRLGCSQAVAYCVDLSVSRVGGELDSCVRSLFPCDGRKQQFFITDSEIAATMQELEKTLPCEDRLK